MLGTNPLEALFQQAAWQTADHAAACAWVQAAPEETLAPSLPGASVTAEPWGELLAQLMAKGAWAAADALLARTGADPLTLQWAGHGWAWLAAAHAPEPGAVLPWLERHGVSLDRSVARAEGVHVPLWAVAAEQLREQPCPPALEQALVAHGQAHATAPSEDWDYLQFLRTLQFLAHDPQQAEATLCAHPSWRTARDAAGQLLWQQAVAAAPQTLPWVLGQGVRPERDARGQSVWFALLGQASPMDSAPLRAQDIEALLRQEPATADARGQGVFSLDPARAYTLLSPYPFKKNPLLTLCTQAPDLFWGTRPAAQYRLAGQWLRQQRPSERSLAFWVQATPPDALARLHPVLLGALVALCHTDLTRAKGRASGAKIPDVTQRLLDAGAQSPTRPSWQGFHEWQTATTSRTWPMLWARWEAQRLGTVLEQPFTETPRALTRRRL